MTSLNYFDMTWIINRLPKVVIEQMKKENIFLAGGYLRSCITREPVNDIDLFVNSVEQAESLAEKLKSKIHSARIHKTDNAYTILSDRSPIQVIHRWTFDHPVDVIKSFDFTIAQAVVFFDQDRRLFVSHCVDNYYSDLAARRLVYTSPIREEEPGGSLLRVLKFYQQGYRIPIGSLGAVIGRLLNGVKEELWEDRKGMEKHEWLGQVAHNLTGLLYEVDPAFDSEGLIQCPAIHPAEVEDTPDA